MMGRFSDEKNNAMFLRAAAEIHRQYPDVRFRLAGQGPLEVRLKNQSRELGIADVVEFCGYMDVEDFMKSIDVYVICSLIENLPYSILEAMAWGRPVIGTNVGGIPDLVSHEQTGYLVASERDTDLAASMASFVANPELVKSLGMVGREKIETSFSLANSVKQHQSIYSSLSGD